MILGFTITICVGLAWAGFGILFSYVASRKLNVLAYYFMSSIFMSLWLGIFYVKWGVVLRGAAPKLGSMIGVMGLTGILNIGGIISMILAMRRGHHGITWTITQSAMIIPFVASILIWGNAVSTKNYIGVFSILFTLVLLGSAKPDTADGKKDPVWAMLAVMSLLFLGVSQIFSTIPSRWEGWTDTSGMRVFVFSASSCVVMTVVALIRKIKPEKKVVLLALCGSVLGFFCQIFFYKGMDLMSAAGFISIVYPLAVATCIVGFALYSRFALKEHFGWKEILGIGIGLAGIVLISVN